MHLADWYRIDFEINVLNKNSIENNMWPLAVKVKVKIKFNATLKLLNIDLVYLAARTKYLNGIVFEISVLLCIKNLTFKMGTKIQTWPNGKPSTP